MRILCVLCFYVFLFGSTHSQNRKTDSLLSLLKTDKEDTNKVNHFNALGWQLMNSNPDTSILISSQALRLAKKLSALPDEAIAKTGKKGIANSLGQLGTYYSLKADYPKALDYYFKALKMNEELGDKNRIATVLGNIGNVYIAQADYPKALDYYFKALKMDEELGDKNGITRHLMNLGIVYDDQADYAKALEYYLKALKMGEELGNKNLIANNLGNIGIVYVEQADYAKALDYFFKALKLREELGAKNLIASVLGNIGNVYMFQADYAKALDYYFKALKMAEEVGDKNRIAINLGNIGNVYNEQANSAYAKGNKTFALGDRYPKALSYYFKALKMAEELGIKNNVAAILGNIGTLYTKTRNFSEAEKYLKRSLALCDSIKVLSYTRDVEKNLSQLYDTTGRTKLAFAHYKKYITARDSISNDEQKKKQLHAEMNYDFEKKKAVGDVEHKKELEKQGAIAEEKSRKQNIIMFSVVGCLLLVAVFSGFIFRSLRLTRKQKDIIEKQKEVVDEKQKEILDSIYYARRIQRALITNEKYFSKNLNRLSKN